MDKFNFIRLINAYLDGSASDADKALLEAYYARLGAEDFPALTTAQEDALEEMMYSEIIAQRNASKPSKPGIRLWPRIASKAGMWKAAAAVAAIMLGTWLYVNEIASSRKASRNDEMVMNDIKPGRNTATLTLANGKTITLSDAKSGVIIDASKLRYNDGSKIDDSPRSAPRNDGEAKTFAVSTPRGGTYQVTLPDGTKAWLNAASSIRFPSSFAGVKQRHIEITGEVYLEVAKMMIKDGGSRNKERRMPFIVESKRQEVTVLGTHFNINAYPDETSTKTTLLEGSVRVSSLRGRTEASRGNLPGRGPSTTQSQKNSEIGFSVNASRAREGLGMARSASRNDEQGVAGTTILKPGQQSAVTGDKRINVKEVSTEEIVSWKNGYFRFNDDTIEEVMRKLARWYDIDVRYEGKRSAELFNGTISRNNNISVILKALNSTNTMQFKVEGRRIIIRQD